MCESEKWKGICSVVFDSSRPHGLQPTRLLRPWDFPGKSTGVGCHCLLQRVKVKSEREVAQSCSTLRDPMDCSPPGSSVHGIFQARALEWAPSPSPMIWWHDCNYCNSKEDEVAGWHHRLNGHEFEQTLGDSEGQRSLASMVLQRFGHKLAT